MPIELAEAMQAMLRSYRLSGSIQLRLPDSELSLGPDGEVTPLEASILRQIGNQGAIVSFKNRTSFNYGRVTLLVSNTTVG